MGQAVVGVFHVVTGTCEVPTLLQPDNLKERVLVEAALRAIYPDDRDPFAARRSGGAASDGGGGASTLPRGASPEGPRGAEARGRQAAADP